MTTQILSMVKCVWRSGTENTPMIVGLGVAAEQATGDWLEGDEHHIKKMRQLLLKGLVVCRCEIHFYLVLRIAIGLF